jgi:hypothetical protein
MWSLWLKKCNGLSKALMNVVCRHCLRPTLSLNFPQATTTAHMLCGEQGS